MIINIDTHDRQSKMIELCFGEWDIFFKKLFDYLTNPCYGTEAAFLYQLTYEIGMQNMFSTTYMFDSRDEKEAIEKISNSKSPKIGFNDMIVVRIRTQYSTYFTKFWEDDVKKMTKMFKAYIKDGYELGRIDDYIGEFEKIR